MLCKKIFALNVNVVALLYLIYNAYLINNDFTFSWLGVYIMESPEIRKCKMM